MNRNAILTAIGLIFLGILIGVVAITGLQLTGASSAQQAKNVVLGSQTYAPKEAMTGFKATNSAFIEASKVVTPTVVSIQVKSTPRAGTSRDPFHSFTPRGGDKKKDEKDDGGGEEEGDADLFRRFFGPRGMERAPMMGSGSGVIISPDGYILTNNHVVKDADEKDGLRVTLSDKREYTAKVVGTDPLTDISVIKIDAQNLPVVPIGDSDGVQVGEWVLAVGNPFRLTSTVTAGIVSAIGRNINIIQSSSGYAIESFIQTDAAINPGNSGGALVNMEGRLIGINTAIATETGSYAGYGFAVPINLAKSVAEDLIKNGKVQRGYIGVSLEQVDAITAKANGLDVPGGVLIQSVMPDGGGRAAGLQQGDIVTSVDGRSVREVNELQAYIARKHPNDKVVLKIWRDRREMEVSVTLKPRPEAKEVSEATPPERKAEPAKTETASLDQLGLEVKNLTKEEKQQYDTDYGVRVSDIDRFGPAASRNLGKDDVILEVDRKKIQTIDDFKRAVAAVKVGDAVNFKIKNARKDTRLVAVQIAAK
ncbi:MAG: Do family serine endopeptidase [Rhizobacter sp.]|nr:Do family serine endopeptidase [Chlorobiales bacterium]